MKKLLIIDNYDSFTYNLVHILESVEGFEIDVLRNDKISIDEVQNYDKIVISPGPGLPSEAGLLMKIIKRYKFEIPMLGVCLGHQAIIESFQGRLENLERVFHGIDSEIHLQDDSCPIFKNLPPKMMVGRYHSWAAEKESFPKDLCITSIDSRGTVMSFRHLTLPIYGVQFHPESVMTPDGKKILTNFLNL